MATNFPQDRNKQTPEQSQPQSAHPDSPSYKPRGIDGIAQGEKIPARESSQFTQESQSAFKQQEAITARQLQAERGRATVETQVAREQLNQPSPPAEQNRSSIPIKLLSQNELEGMPSEQRAGVLLAGFVAKGGPPKEMVNRIKKGFDALNQSGDFFAIASYGNTLQEALHARKN